MVTKLELETGNSCNAIGHFFVHRTANLQLHINGLREKLKRTVKLAFFLGDVRLGEVVSHVLVLVLDLLDVGEELADV